MSHAPNNTERHWDAGNADTDIVALVPCRAGNTGPIIAAEACFFTFGALRQSVDSNQISRLKAASEGSEQHLTWPAIVSNRPGVVIDVTPTRLKVEWTGDGKPPRRHTYALNGKVPYVSRGERFAGETQFLAGSPSAVADLCPYLTQHFLGHQIGIDADLRVALEVANTAVGLGVSSAAEFIRNVIHGEADSPMRMEAIFIVTELGRRGQVSFATSELDSIASDPLQRG